MIRSNCCLRNQCDRLKCIRINWSLPSVLRLGSQSWVFHSISPFSPSIKIFYSERDLTIISILITFIWSNLSFIVMYSWSRKKIINLSLFLSDAWMIFLVSRLSLEIEIRISCRKMKLNFSQLYWWGYNEEYIAQKANEGYSHFFNFQCLLRYLMEAENDAFPSWKRVRRKSKVVIFSLQL